MVNSDNNPIFVNSVLKVTAKEDIDITKELANENTENKTIQELLQEKNESKEK